MILLDQDLENDFGISREMIEGCPRKDLYKMMNDARMKSYATYCETMESNLKSSSKNDKITREYFNALLAHNGEKGHSLFKDLYLDTKKQSMPTKLEVDLTVVIDNTASMAPFAGIVYTTIEALLEGSGSFINELKRKFPVTELKIRLALLGYRNIDGTDQFFEPVLEGNSRFTENISTTLRAIKGLVSSARGGGDIAEDHLAAIHRLTSCKEICDSVSKVKMSILFTDGPCHGLVPLAYHSRISDNYGNSRASRWTVEQTADDLLESDIQLLICSLDPSLTSRFEEEISSAYATHEKNTEENEIITIPLIPIRHNNENDDAILKSCNKHIVFVLDESTSMRCSWPGVVEAYNKFIQHRRQHQFEQDLVSIVQFSHVARVSCERKSIVDAPTSLSRIGLGTRFSPAATSAYDVVNRTPPSHVPVVVFMSDGIANDSREAATILTALNQEWKSQVPVVGEIELHVIGFGGGTCLNQLNAIAGASTRGKVHSAADIDSLLNVFVDIAGGCNNVNTLLEDAISQRVSGAVVDRLTAEYIR